ncbi:MAG: glycosyltransferase family 2 protein [Victivallales bacterium]|nr:glycosyltransferase family 2 protein [Victivallales bacterium]
MKLISLVIPCYNEESGIGLLYKTALEAMRPLEGRAQLEFRFVDDGSHDGTLDAIRALRVADERVHYCSFSRNFGKEAAMLAGMESAKGDYVVVMDADLQEPPDLIPKMFEMLEEGDCDCVATFRKNRSSKSLFKNACARLFYWLMSRMTEIELKEGARDFRMMNRAYLQSVLSLKESNRFSKGIFVWVGHRVKWLFFDFEERQSGETKWSFWKLLKYALEGITAFSTIPLSISFGIGLLTCLFAAILCIKTIVKTLFFGEPIPGYTTILVCLTFFSGLQFIMLGVTGLYISKIYKEVKRRPPYVIQEER